MKESEKKFSKIFLKESLFKKYSKKSWKEAYTVRKENIINF
jgi:hypothetical protein